MVFIFVHDIELKFKACYSSLTDGAIMAVVLVNAVALLQAADERNPSQFIVTTFHPQIIQQADKIYGVSHKNRISQCVPSASIRCRCLMTWLAESVHAGASG